MSELQLFAPLPQAVEDALRASIRRFGVLVPVVKDQNGRTVDGHHRSRIADELGVEYKVDVRHVADEAEAKELARTLNSDRRHLSEEQRRQVVLLLAGETVAVGREEVARHSPEAIAGALGVDRKTVVSDIEELGNDPKFNRPDKTLGLDGKVRPTKRPPQPEPAEEPAGERRSSPPKPAKRTQNRKPLPDTARAAGWELNKAVERITRVVEDDRYTQNAEQVAIALRSHFIALFFRAWNHWRAGQSITMLKTVRPVQIPKPR